MIFKTENPSSGPAMPTWFYQEGILTKSTDIEAISYKNCTKKEAKLYIERYIYITRETYVSKVWELLGRPKTTTASTFEDIENSNFKESIGYAQENKLVIGTTKGKFSPQECIRRGDALLILYRLAGEPKTESTKTFEDVPEDSYYKKVVDWAVKNGIASETEENKFSPEEPCRREDAIAFLEKYFNLNKELSLKLKFVDNNDKPIPEQKFKKTLDLKYYFESNSEGVIDLKIPTTEGKKGSNSFYIYPEGLNKIGLIEVNYEKDDNNICKITSLVANDKAFTKTIIKQTEQYYIIKVDVDQEATKDKIKLDIDVEYESDDATPIYNLKLLVKNGTTKTEDYLKNGKQTIEIIPNENAEKVELNVLREKVEGNGTGKQITVSFTKEDGEWIAKLKSKKSNAELNGGTLTIILETEE